jgi:aryl-alcohol dehydrogenase-like predicted oxidoreductase
VSAQIERSFERMRLDVIDLNQVHRMGDPPTQLGILQEYKDSGRTRYIGITTTSENQHDNLRAGHAGTPDRLHQPPSSTRTPGHRS